MRLLNTFDKFSGYIKEGIIQFSPQIEQALEYIYLRNIGDLERYSSILLNLSKSSKELKRPDFNLIDSSNERGFFSYQSSNQLRDPETYKKLLNRDEIIKMWHGPPSRGGLWGSDRKQKVRIGSLITKILSSDEVSFSGPVDINVVTELVNQLNQIIYTTDTSGFEFRIVKGQEIKKWYLEDIYCKSREGSDYSGSTLKNSCMRYSECQDRFGIYTENPDVCSLVLLVNEKEELEARALLWNATLTLEDGKEEEVKFMDRIYYNHQDYLLKFGDYGYNNKFVLKKKQTSEGNWSKTLVVPDKGEVTGLLKVKIQDISDLSPYPYVDTLSIYVNDHGDDFTIGRGYLTNENDFSRYKNECYELWQFRNHNYGKKDVVFIGKKSEWEAKKRKNYQKGDYKLIPSEHAVQSKYLQYRDNIFQDLSWIDKRKSYELLQIVPGIPGEVGWIPDDHPRACECLYLIPSSTGALIRIKSLKEELCVWSYTIEEWIHRDSVIWAVDNIDEHLYVENLDASLKTEIGKTILHLPNLIDTPGGKTWVRLFQQKNNNKWINKEIVDDEGYLINHIIYTGISPLDGLYYTQQDSQVLNRGVESFNTKTCKFDYYYKMAPVMKKLAKEQNLKNEDAWLKKIDWFTEEFKINI